MTTNDLQDFFRRAVLHLGRANQDSLPVAGCRILYCCPPGTSVRVHQAVVVPVDDVLYEVVFCVQPPARDALDHTAHNDTRPSWDVPRIM